MATRLQRRVNAAMRYAMACRGAHYGWWRGGAVPAGPPAYWYPAKAPSAAKVRRRGVFCAGVSNLMLRRVGKRPPRGGTGAYWVAYRHKMRRYRHGVRLPKGTLLFRRYRNVRDQGHVALVIGNGYLLQAMPGKGCNSRVSRHASHMWRRAGYYEFMLLPRDWLG